MFSMMMQIVRNVLNDRKGVTALEYGVLAAGIVLVVATAAATLGGKVGTLFGSVGSAL